ncbi:gliding motility lipoprotein GldB [Psychroserpens sp.]|uniref:gliding motility lipoprotein GldB n=1 Tax=Psychroserpens sp. TaxID=2020870 RepID=UPI001B19B728|nr:gliding motility lipoprotein GldB [Psychroserpens sp.]MBO6607962.1 gliding motility lipoprotein GldB [Psychroserpens sp.]MBO6631114.1 gliding motility lipoprotein GldB [Psychroserpens sp.]MBO6654911.1 gliding motility lipoprotein GldB [Psychroserpens sp.]MBO6683015.1 gliding motility lipoprotein GldB [Psychroserpens sp.]MBO6751320.1 gliding motility lipoprotein GldB [Psychroserpens sp.]
MKQLLVFGLLFALIFGCKNEDALESEIAKVKTDFIVERFDLAFANAKPQDLTNLKNTFPFLFSKRIPDSIWLEQMVDTFQLELNSAVKLKHSDISEIESDVRNLFKHLKFYEPTFQEPRVITLTNFVKYRNKVAVTDSIVLVALDNYLGADHEFYANIPQYIVDNMTTSQVVVDLATAYSEQRIFQLQKKTLLDEMIYFGKQLYFKDIMIPFKSDAEKIGYSETQLGFARANEEMIWTHFVENEMLFDTDNDLPARFIADAPFSKFYLEIDNETPGRLGQYIGWQIVRAYMKNNDVPLNKMMQTEASEIFNKSNYKPPK